MLLALLLLQQPNLLLVVTDDHPAPTVSTYRTDGLAVTPNLDALAAAGIRFTGCISQYPVCSPARATILTGRYPDQHLVRDNQMPLSAGDVTLAEILTAQGYRCGAVGKGCSPTDPQNIYTPSQGWAYSEDPGKDSSLISWDPSIPPELIPDAWAWFNGTQQDHRDYRAAQLGISFIQTTQPGQPWCLWLALHATHNPIAPWPPLDTAFQAASATIALPPVDDMADKPAWQAGQQRTSWWPWGGPQWREQWSRKLGDSAGLDSNLGLVLAALPANTLVVVVADQGSYTGEHGFLGKVPGTFYRPYVESVLLACGPGLQPAVRSDLVEQVDILPTILDWLGLPPVASVQGLSVAAGPANAYAFSQAGGSYMVTDGVLKLVEAPNGIDQELYNLAVDPDELSNKVGNRGYAAVQALLNAQLTAFRAGAYK